LESGDKEVRAAPLASQAKGGNMFVCEGKWRSAYIAELSTFPRGLYADQVDASSRAYARLIEKRIAAPPARPEIFGVG
jgi:predicted phage terminase large subunit-like protein